MCGRYLFYDDKVDYIVHLVEQVEMKFPEINLRQKDIYPSQQALVAKRKQEMTTLDFYHWGIALKKNLVINGKSETAFSSPFFAGSKPIIIPCSGYYEWNTDKEKYLFNLNDQPLFLAGLAKEKHFVILTEKASEKLSLIHPRMPVCFDYENAKAWCLSDNPMLQLKNSIQNRLYQKV